MSLWDNLRKQIQEEYKNNPGGFLREPTVRKCLHPLQKEMRNYLKKTGDYCRYFTDPIYGNPQILVEGKSSFTIQHVYYTWLMEKTWKNISFDNIVDIGGLRPPLDRHDLCLRGLHRHLAPRDGLPARLTDHPAHTA